MSGIYKGRSISTNRNADYRPTKSIVRKSLFDTLGPLNGKTFLDLFSGSGIMGFEALSRGAVSSDFVESNYKHIQWLKENGEKFLSSKIAIHHIDVVHFLNQHHIFDYIFADPPYHFTPTQGFIDSALNNLSKNGIFILELKRTKSKLVYDPKIRNFGKSQLAFWEKA